MIQGRSRTPSPGLGVNTRRTALHGLPVSRGIHGNDFRERSGPMSAEIPTGSSESSAKSTEGSSSEDLSGRPSQSDSSSTFPQFMNTGRSKVVDSPAEPPTQPHLQLRNAQWANATHGTVDEVVYCSAKSLTAIPPGEVFTFFGDMPRTTIVVKWMRFYHYYPNIDKATDKLRRDELKAQLNIPSGNGQRLGSFIINKFNNFRKWGYLYWDGKHHVEYSPSTDAWLGPNWDGHIERQQVSIPRNTRSPNSQRGPTKRQASTRIQQREKRQKSMGERSTTSPVTSKTTLSNKSANMSAMPAPLPSQHQRMMNERPNGGLEGEDNPSFNDNRNNSPYQNETNNVRRKQERHSSRDESTSPVNGSTNHISGAPNITRTILGGPPKRPNLPQPAGLSNDGDTRTDEVGKYPLRGRDLAPNPQELSARLEAINAQSTSSMTNGGSSSHHLPGARKHMGALGPLREKEKSCIQTLRKTIKELESTREEHQQLCQQYETLKAEGRVFLQIVEQNSRRQKALAAPTPIGVVEADYADSLQDVVQNRKENDFLRLRQEEKSRLETQIAETAEAKSNLKICIAAKKIELKKLQRDIKETLKVNARTDRFKGKLSVYLDDFKDVGGYSRSGTTSPVESVPESVSSEMNGVDLLSEADGSSELSDLDSECSGF